MVPRTFPGTREAGPFTMDASPHMAANNPSKGNFLQTLILTALLMLGFQLMCNQQNVAQQAVPFEGKELKTVADFRGALLNANTKLLDVSAAGRLKSGHDARVDAELKEKKITEDDAKRLKTEAAVLVADAQLDRKSTRLNSSHSTLSRMPSSA